MRRRMRCVVPRVDAPCTSFALAMSRGAAIMRARAPEFREELRGRYVDLVRDAGAISS